MWTGDSPVHYPSQAAVPIRQSQSDFRSDLLRLTPRRTHRFCVLLVVGLLPFGSDLNGSMPADG